MLQIAIPGFNFSRLQMQSKAILVHGAPPAIIETCGSGHSRNAVVDAPCCSSAQRDPPLLANSYNGRHIVPGPGGRRLINLWWQQV